MFWLIFLMLVNFVKIEKVHQKGMFFGSICQKRIKSASKLHRKCIKSASKVHQKCIKSAFTYVSKIY